MTQEQLIEFETQTLKRLTDERLAGHALPPEAEEMLALAGIYWDEETQEYSHLAYILGDACMKSLVDSANFN